jgi:hypothetical protein
VEHRHDDESASINRRDAATVRADYAAWLAGQPLRPPPDNVRYVK